ncbi:hypothetical protein A6B34_21460 [Mycolicibacterium monacense]|nr:hypothetical protein A6B34_21460 [Mycolicibacterium monacense]OBF52406.1 hypothetical protein A5778_14810 [Mycolicibacterium monacense]
MVFWEVPFCDGDRQVITDRAEPSSECLGFGTANVVFDVVLSDEQAAGDDARVAHGDLRCSCASDEFGDP